LEQFVENASESPQHRKVLRVIHAPSDVIQKLPFATDYLAWRETQSFVYCKDENISIISLLRWNDFSNADAIQWWRLVPFGFGIFFDVRAGSKWIAIAGPASSPFDPDLLATPNLFIPDEEQGRVTDPVIRHPEGVYDSTITHPEGILLTAGMRM